MAGIALSQVSLVRSSSLPCAPHEFCYKSSVKLILLGFGIAPPILLVLAFGTPRLLIANPRGYIAATARSIFQSVCSWIFAESTSEFTLWPLQVPCGSFGDAYVDYRALRKIDFSINHLSNFLWKPSDKQRAKLRTGGLMNAIRHASHSI
jgi:hypothetical protein